MTNVERKAHHEDESDPSELQKADTGTEQTSGGDAEGSRSEIEPFSASLDVSPDKNPHELLPPVRSPRFLSASYRGPLPPPATLKEYDATLPGLAERIVVMSEKEQMHRHTMQREALQGELEHRRGAMKLRRLGLVLGFIVVQSALIAGAWLLWLGQEGWGLALVIGALASLALAFIWGRQQTPSQVPDSRQEPPTPNDEPPSLPP